MLVLCPLHLLSYSDLILNTAPGDPLDPDVTYRVRFQKVPEQERDDGKRLQLLLDRSVGY